MKYFSSTIFSCVVLIIFFIFAFRIIKRRIKDISNEVWSFGAESAYSAISGFYGATKKGYNALADAYGLKQKVANKFGDSSQADAAFKNKERYLDKADGSQYGMTRSKERARLYAERRRIAAEKLNPYADTKKLTAEEKNIVNKINKHSELVNKEKEGAKKYGSIRKFLEKESPDSIKKILGNRGDVEGLLSKEALDKKDSVSFSEAEKLFNNTVNSEVAKGIMNYMQSSAVETKVNLSVNDTAGLKNIVTVKQIESGIISNENMPKIMSLFKAEELANNGINYDVDEDRYKLTDYKKASSFLESKGLSINTDNSKFDIVNSQGQAVVGEESRKIFGKFTDKELETNGLYVEDDGSVIVASAVEAMPFLEKQNLRLAMVTNDFELEAGTNMKDIIIKDNLANLSDSTQQLLGFNKFVEEQGFSIIEQSPGNYRYMMNREVFNSLSNKYFSSRLANDVDFRDNIKVFSSRSFEGDFDVKDVGITKVDLESIPSFKKVVDDNAGVLIKGSTYDFDEDSGTVLLYNNEASNILKENKVIGDVEESKVITSKDVLDKDSYMKAAVLAFPNAKRYGDAVIVDSKDSRLEIRKAVSTMEDKINPVAVDDNLRFDVKDRGLIEKIAKENGIYSQLKYPEDNGSILVKVDESDQFLEFFESVTEKGIKNDSVYSVRCNNKNKLDSVIDMHKDLFKNSKKLSNDDKELILSKDTFLLGETTDLEEIFNDSVKGNASKVKKLGKGKIQCQDTNKALEILTDKELDMPYIEGIHYEVFGSEISFKPNTELYNNEEALNEFIDFANTKDNAILVDREKLDEINKFLVDKGRRELEELIDYLDRNNIIFLKSDYAKIAVRDLNNQDKANKIKGLEKGMENLKRDVLGNISSVLYKDVYDKDVLEEQGSVFTVNFGNKINNSAFFAYIKQLAKEDESNVFISALSLAGIDILNEEGVIKTFDNIKFFTRDDLATSTIKSSLEEMLDDRFGVVIKVLGRKKVFFIEKRFESENVSTEVTVPDDLDEEFITYRLNFYEDKGNFYIEDIVNGGFVEVNEKEIDKDEAINCTYFANTVDTKKILKNKLDKRKENERLLRDKTRFIDDFKQGLGEKLGVENDNDENFDLGDMEEENMDVSIGKVINSPIKEASNEIKNVVGKNKEDGELKSFDYNLVEALLSEDMKYSLARRAVEALESNDEKYKKRVFVYLVNYLEAEDKDEDEAEDGTAVTKEDLRSNILFELENLLVKGESTNE